VSPPHYVLSRLCKRRSRCEFSRTIDADGVTWSFFDKPLHGGCEAMTPTASYPLPSSFDCEIVRTEMDARGDAPIVISTLNPNGLESTNGKSEFRTRGSCCRRRDEPVTSQCPRNPRPGRFLATPRPVNRPVNNAMALRIFIASSRLLSRSTGYTAIFGPETARKTGLPGWLTRRSLPCANLAILLSWCKASALQRRGSWPPLDSLSCSLPRWVFR